MREKLNIFFGWALLGSALYVLITALLFAYDTYDIPVTNAMKVAAFWPSVLCAIVSGIAYELTKE